MSVEAKLNEALEQINFYERVITSLRTQPHQEHLLKAQVELESKIATLPTEAKERLRQALPGVVLDGLKQAVNIEKRGAR